MTGRAFILGLAAIVAAVSQHASAQEATCAQQSGGSEDCTLPAEADGVAALQLERWGPKTAEITRAEARSGQKPKGDEPTKPRASLMGWVWRLPWRRWALSNFNRSLSGNVYLLEEGQQNRFAIGNYWNTGMLAEMPALGVNPRTVGDIQQTLAFARRYGLQVNMKVDGHSYSGASAGNGLLVIWMGGSFKRVTVRRGNYADSCGTRHGNVIQAQGGSRFLDLYSALGPDWVSPGGTCESVGAAGGWVLGTGLGFEQQRTIGLGPDVVIDFEVVLADGTYKRVDRCSEPRLFKALRGGGGGFAIIISATYPLYPASPVSEWFVGFDRKLHAASTDPWWAWLVKWAPRADRRWSFKSVNNWDDRNKGIFVLGVWFLGPRSVAVKTRVFKELRALWQAVPARARIGYTEAPDGRGKKNTGQPGEYASFQKYKLSQRVFSSNKAWYYRDPGQGVPGSLRPYYGNRLIPKSYLLQRPKRAVALFKSLEGKTCDHFYHLGGKVGEFDSAFSSVNPNLRDAIFQVGLCDEPTLQRLKDLFPNSVSGNGLNHAGWDEPDWREANWGAETYRGLLETKREYDPEARFWCRHCVGSE